MEELAVEGIAITIPGYVEPAKPTGQMGGYLFLGYNSYDNGKPYIQTVGYLHITPDCSKFAITFANGELGAAKDDFRVASYPAHNREEAVQSLKTVLQETNHVWRHAIWE